MAKRAAAELQPPQLWGSWDGWAAAAPARFEEVLGPDGTRWRRAVHRVAPGRYQYAIRIGERLLLDEINPHSGFAPDPLRISNDPLSTEVSELDLSRCREPDLEVTEVTASDTGLTVRARFRPGEGGARLDAGALTAVLRRGDELLPLPRAEVDGADEVTLRATGLAPGKHAVELFARGVDGLETPKVLASALVGPGAPRQRGDGLVYHLIVDRFRPPGAPATPGDRAGGTLDGVRAAVEEGYFERLGVTTLWLSPLYQNPVGRFTGRDGHSYEAYHGYWPSEPRTVEPALGGEAALDALSAAAHARGLRLILDAVPNHVHESHPYFRAHSSAVTPRATWFNDGPTACVCGAPGCGWGERLLDCWFDRYLPDLDWRRPEVVAAGVDDLRWWMARFDLDGVRIDAVPMMPRSATRRMARGLRSQAFRPGLDLVVLGENYTGPGDAGRAAIRAYLGRDLDGLDSAFDFPLMWSMRQVLAHGAGALSDLEGEIAASDAAWAGSDATMAHIIGNHDTTRFLSEAAGDAAPPVSDPWTAPPAQPSDAAPYRRHLLAMTLLLTLPGLPVIYYGDELALAGATDPDSRRPLPRAEALPPAQREVLEKVSRLGRLRRCLPALRHAGRRALYASADQLVALHAPPLAGGEAAIVVLSRAENERRIPVRGLPAGAYVDALSGRTLTVAGDSAEIVAGPLAAAVYLPETSACVE
ncbi:MAG TPA: alpha-amylase family glycosyl hydrolase [Kofleriaceae bacterium]|nr:alpha-amylase family glycosyl hydrolase [Kofleriaceae bacterium]